MEGSKQEYGARLLPLALEVQYTIQSRRLSVVGAGRTSLMSSREIVFKSDRPIPHGTNLRLSIAWPATLDHHVGLQLIVDGMVTHMKGDSITVSVARHHFRTRALAKTQEGSAGTVLSEAVMPVRAWMSAQAVG